MQINALTRILVAISLLAAASMADAYIGPGSGISLLGGIWSVLVGVVLALAAILIWPIRLMLKRMRARKAPQTGQATPNSETDPQ